MGDAGSTEPAHVQLYAYAVAQPRWTLEAAADHLGLTRQEVAGARDTLAELRLLQPAGSAGDFVAVSPDIAVADRTHEDRERIRELTAEVDQIRTELEQLIPTYALARQQRHERDRAVEVLESPQAVARLVYDAVAQIRVRAYILHPRVTFRAEMHEASKAYDQELLERGVDRRNIYHEGTVHNAATRRAVADLVPLGVRFRVLPVVPVHAIIYDDDLAIVSRRSTPDDRAALVIRDPDLVAVARHAFEALWDCAAPFPTGELAEPTDGPSEIQTRILEGLVAGLTDEAIARRGGIHVRTLRRHLTQLEGMAGAQSRFQLALRARDLGWI